MRNNCANCNADQAFARRQRELPNGNVEIYIQCDMCRWESVLFVGSPETLKLRSEIDQLNVAGRRRVPVKRLLEKRLSRLREGAIKDAPEPDTTD